MGKLLNQTVNVLALDTDAALLDTDAAVEVLNRILHLELNGVMQHFHHHWMSRRLHASRARAITIGQHIAALTAGPAVGVDALMGDALVSSDELLDAARSYDRGRIAEYRRLLELVEGRSDDLEAFARAQIAAEERHLAELTDD
jgi:bacterioferritin